MDILGIFTSRGETLDMICSEELPTIRNLKIGVNISIRKYKEWTLKKSTLNVVNHSNYSVIRDVFVYIIFWSGDYVNVTKIPSSSDIDKSVQHFKKILKIKHCKYTITIHNICASGKFIRPYNLKRLHRFLKQCDLNAKIKLNQSIFPALYVKFKSGTCIIFQNGKYTVVGCDSEKQITRLVSSVCACMKTR